MIKNIFIVVSIFVITACGGGGSSDDPINTNDPIIYTNWTGSTNETYVVDATNDLFQFEYTSGLMHFGNTTITNVWVDSSANLYFNSQIIGKVTYIESTSGSTITGLISTSGYFIDFYGPESSLTWKVSSKKPVYVTASLNKSNNIFSIKALESTNNDSRPVEYMLSAPNAIIENRPLNSEGYATENNK